MGKKLKEFAVVFYPEDKLASICHISDIAPDDKRITKISTHVDIPSAEAALKKYAGANPDATIQACYAKDAETAVASPEDSEA